MLTDQKIYPDKFTIRVELVVVSTQNIVLQPENHCTILNLEIWNLVQYSLFSAYLTCIKGVEVLSVFFEAVIAMRSWVTICLFLVAVAATSCGLLLASALVILL